MIKRLKLENWRQFATVDIDFHPRLTTIAGVNGSGKTTLLKLLAECTGVSPTVYSLDLKKVAVHADCVVELMGVEKKEQIDKTIFRTPLAKKEKIRGLFIRSHRPTFPYRELENMPTSVSSREDIYKRYAEFSEKAAVYKPLHISGKLIRETANLIIKRDLASLATFGYGNPAVKPIESARILFEGYCDILRKILPKTLGFQRISIDMPEVVMETDTGNFPIDNVSGGISSIIDITWQLYMFAEPNTPFVALIDEPENHLHPELQKSFLGTLIETFPHVQFIVATHNPLIISAQKDSHVYVLDYKDNQVHSTLLDHINRAGTSSAILRDVLGLDTTIPIWAEEALEATINKYSQEEITQASINAMGEELESLGLGDYVPDSVAQVLENGAL